MKDKLKKFYQDHKEAIQYGVIYASYILLAGLAYKSLTRRKLPKHLDAIFFERDGQSWMVLGGTLFKKD
jgi:hypothetical protein